MIEKLGITPGPWRWRVDSTFRHVVLFDKGFNIVMDFVRYGMQHAQPRFNIKGLMVKSSDLAIPYIGFVHHAKWDQDIDNPTARLIKTAPEILEALIESQIHDEKLFGGNDYDYQKIIEKATGKKWEEIKELL